MTSYLLDTIEEDYREAIYTTSDERTPRMEHIIRLHDEYFLDENIESEEECLSTLMQSR